MLVTLYKIQDLQYNKNNTIKFDSVFDRKDYFDNINITEEITATLSPNWIKNIWKLDNQITVFNEGRYPHIEYNYLSVQENIDSKVYYFHIVDYEELGNNQIKYILKKDTLMTYVTTPNEGIDIESKPALILREHKNRFAGTNPIYNKTIEPLDVIPNVMTQEQVIPQEDITLVLKSYGGNLKGTDILSHPKYAWEVHDNDYKTYTQEPLFVTLPLGWGFRKLSTAIMFSYTDVNGVDSSVKLKSYAWNQNDIIKHVKDADGLHYLEAWSHLGVKRNLDSANTTLSGSATYDNNKVLLNNFKDDTVLFGSASANSTYEVLGDLGINSKKYIDANYYISYAKGEFGGSAYSKPAYEIDYSNAKNQKIIKIPYIPKTAASGFNLIINAGGGGVKLESLTPIKFDDFEINMFNKTFDTSKVIKNRVLLNEPKLFTSQFRPYFITWFGESLLLKREYIYTDTINFKSKLNDSDYTKVVLYNTNPDFQNKPFELSRVIDMNNVVATVSSDLEKYLSLQADNDLKLMQLQNSKANRNIAQQAVNTVANVGAGAAAGFFVSGLNPVGAAVGAVSGIAKGATNIGFALAGANQAKEERKLQYENKMNNLQASLINISGGNYELSEATGATALRVFSLKPNNNELAYLDEYFHKYGYETLELKKPVLKTRVMFDYKRMIVDEIETFAPVTEEVKLDIIRRFQEGVTIYHPYNNALDIDFKQEKENWEV